MSYFSEKNYSCCEKHAPVWCLWFLGVFPKTLFSIFTYQKSSQIFKEYLCRPLSGVGEIEFSLHYPSNATKYTTSDPYWIQNNPLFDTPFCMHYNLKTIIKRFSRFGKRKIYPRRYYICSSIFFPSKRSFSANNIFC